MALAFDSKPESRMALMDVLAACETDRALALSALLGTAPHPLPAQAATASLPISAVEGWPSTSLWHCLPADIRASVPKRRSAFVAGRLCAEHALRSLGCTQPIGRGTSGEPLWPNGVNGSITHTGNTAYATAIRTDVQGWQIGIDSEPFVDEQGLRDVIHGCCTATEKATLFDGQSDHMTASIVFSLKEAFYKAIFAEVRRVVEFSEVEVHDLDAVLGRAALRSAADGLLQQMLFPVTARFEVLDRVVHAAVAAPVRIAETHR